MSVNRQDKRARRRQKDAPRDATADDVEEVDGSDGVAEDAFEADEAVDLDEDVEAAPAGTRTRTAVPRRSSVTAAPPRRASPRQFLHEVNVEMRKVAWPSRTTTINYSSVVIATLAIVMALIFGLDLGFSKLAVYLFK